MQQLSQEVKGQVSSSRTTDDDRLQSRSTTLTLSTRIFFISILFLAGMLRLPALQEGLPYFHREDEAHHFNRVVQMMQSGDLNPHYFHKPSLHFYMRIPVAAASFLWTVKNGHIRSVHDIRTKDTSGIAGYNFTASHPGIVKWNRALSLLFCLGSIAFAMLLAQALFPSTVPAVLTGLLLACSPDFIIESSVIGVDMPMTFFVVSCVYLAILSKRFASIKLLYGAAALAGFALSTKYNALPIVAVPLLAALGSRLPWYHALLAPLVSALAFLAGSPYILVSLPLFLDQFAYEIWHYGIAGHVGHSAEPGIPQFLFYSSWLMHDALGMLAVALILPGAFLLCYYRKVEAIIALAFPLFFILLMINQKANFTRNMLVVLPFLAMLAAGGVSFFSFFGFLKRKSFLWILAALIFIQPLYQATRSIQGMYHEDSRDDVIRYLKQDKFLGATALDGALWLPQVIDTHNGKKQLAVTGLTRLPALENVAQLYNQGFDRLVYGPESASSLSADQLRIVQEFSGIDEAQRIVINPHVRIATIQEAGVLEDLVKKAVTTLQLEKNSIQCVQNGQALSPADLPEGQCWISTRVSAIEATAGSHSFSIMTPWQDQQLTIQTGDGETLFDKELSVGKFQDITLVVPQGSDRLLLFLSKVYSPHSRGINTDTRRLGVAVRKQKTQSLKP